MAGISNQYLYKVQNHIKTFITIFFLLVAVAGFSQKNLALYHVAGNVSVISKNKTTPAIRGNTISSGDKLLLKEGGVCMLIESAGKSLQVSKPGTYTYESLLKLLQNANKDAVTSKFFSYVYDNMFNSHESDRQAVAPVVFRDQGLMVAPFDNSVVFLSPVLTWKMPLRNLYVRLLIRDFNNKNILDTVIKNFTSLKTLDLLPGMAYQWKAEEAGNKQSPERYFHFLIADEKDRGDIEKDMKMLKSKTLSTKLQSQLRGDIYLKWREYYGLSSGGGGTSIKK